MEPHDLPSIYPGAVIGLLIGFAFGGFSTGLIGMVSGFLGAAAALALKPWTAAAGTTGSFISLIVLSALFSIVAVKAFAHLRKS